MTLTGMVAGAITFLVPAAFMLRSPDAWRFAGCSSSALCSGLEPSSHDRLGQRSVG